MPHSAASLCRLLIFVGPAPGNTRFTSTFRPPFRSAPVQRSVFSVRCIGHGGGVGVGGGGGRVFALDGGL